MPFTTRRLAAAVALAAVCAAPLVKAQSQGNGNGNGNGNNSNSATVLVRATVQGLCRIQTGTNPTLQFNIDPSVAGRQIAQTDISFKCTRGTNFALAINNVSANGPVTGLTLKHASRSAQDALPYTLSYSLDKTSGQGFGNNNDIKLTVTAAVDDFADALAGDYEDTVIVEIRP